MMVSALLLMLTLSPPQGAAPDGQEVQMVLASARGLYASAAYEEALAALGDTESVEPEVAAEMDRYRALCFFALGNTDAARASVVKLVQRSPLYVPAEADVPPRLLTMLHEVRRELLPDIARKEYADIRGQLPEKRPETIPTLEQIVRITSDPDVSGIEGMEDLRLLADGFLTLAKAAAPPPAPPASRPADTPSPAAPADRPVIYTAADTDVVPPQTLDQTLPPWNSTSRTGMTFTGYLRVLIDESGLVETAALLRTIHPLYDPQLLRAAENWRFAPAKKSGSPVKYLKVVRIVVKDQ